MGYVPVRYGFGDGGEYGLSNAFAPPNSIPTSMMRLGTQGWNYAAWVGPFYPSGTRPADFLTTYARAFDTVEVDSTFYAIPSERTVLGWAERTPNEFVFSLKMPREVTHDRRLRGTDELVSTFLDRVRLLGPKLGVVLVQFGPDFGISNFRDLSRFLGTLPTDVRFAVEFRQAQWITSELLELLRDRGVALALNDGPWIPRETLLELASRPTAGFSYVRWMGPDRNITDFSHVQVDRSRELEAWTVALRTLRELSRAFGYTNNHFAGHGPATAREVQRLLGIEPVDPRTLGDQMTLF